MMDPSPILRCSG